MMCALAVSAATLWAQAAQSPDTAFGVATANNQVYIGGQVSGAIAGQQAFGKSDAFVQAYDQNGNVLWTSELGTSAKDEVNGVGADSTGVYVGGLTEGAFPGQSFLGATDLFVAKYDLNGNQLWLHEYGTTGLDRIQAGASDGTYFYVAGYTSGRLEGLPSFGGQDAFVQKWDQNGNLVWTVQFGTSGTDRAYGVVANAMGVFVCGRTDGTFSGHTSSGGLDAFLAAFDADGNLTWLNQFGTSADERGWGVGADSTGVYVTGRTEGAFPGQTYLGNDDAYTTKFDYQGNQLWLKEFGTPQFDRGTAVSTDLQHGVYSVGYTGGTLPMDHSAGSSDVYVRKFDQAGHTLWTVQFGSSQYDTAWSTATDSTGVYVSGSAGGMLPNQTGTPSPSGYFLQKLDFKGNLVWTREVPTR